MPVLVELKRAVDTRLRREVIGQMLDYAANGTAYWQRGRLIESFATTTTARGLDPDAELAAFLGAAFDPQQFWEQVDANFAAGRIKMVFVADTIPRELARIVEFLNEQMRADVRAVELSWFESEDGVTALTPRIIGETERAQAEKAARSVKPPIERDEWIQEHLARFGATTVNAAEMYIRLVDEAGGRSEVTISQGSIVAAFDLVNDTIYPVALTKYGKGLVQLSLNYIANRPAFSAETVRKELYDRLVAIVGPLTTDKLNGFPAFPLVKLTDPEVQKGVAGFLRHILELAKTQN